LKSLLIDTVKRKLYLETGLCIDNNKIYLYGGIGGEKTIKWA
jgi:hypothetical protein